MTENDLDVLQRAALLVRNKAVSATQGPWEADGFEVHETTSKIGDLVADAGLTTHDARWIALIGPDAGILLADWLDNTAHSLETWLSTARKYGADPDYQDHQYMPAVRFARKVLKECGQ